MSGRRPGSRFPLGRLVLSLLAVAAPVGSFAADWNATHVFNPKWTPHAKFHNAQTISLAVLAGALTLWEAWRPGPVDRARLRTTAVFASLFWVTQLPAPFFPGSAVVDPDNPIQPTRRFGIPINQVTGAALIVALIVAAYRWDARLRLCRDRHGPCGIRGRLRMTCGSARSARHLDDARVDG